MGLQPTSTYQSFWIFQHASPKNNKSNSRPLAVVLAWALGTLEACEAPPLVQSCQEHQLFSHHLSISIRMPTYIYLHLSTSIYIYIYIYMCVCVVLCLCVHLYLLVYMSMYIKGKIFLQICIYNIYIYIYYRYCIHICIHP